MIDRFAGCDGRLQRRCFRGGTLRGVLSKLDYIQSLGCSGILLTPFYKTNEYHGYHVLDYEQVDPHFGTWDDVSVLVDETHRRGMTIAADIVANHCHKDNILVKTHPDWFKHDNDGNLKCYYGIDFLPEFDFSNYEARNYMIKIGKKLCHIGFDALRIDYAKGLPLNFLRQFSRALHHDAPCVKLIGEVWGKPDGKRLPSTLSHAVKSGEMSLQDAWQKRYAGILDGVMDFESQFLIVKTVRAGQNITNNVQLAAALHLHFSHYADVPNYQLWKFLDNHDTNRFLYECGDDMQQLRRALDILNQQPYPTLLYYGTERGMTNRVDVFGSTPYADEHARQCMRWNAPLCPSFNTEKN